MREKGSRSLSGSAGEWALCACPPQPRAPARLPRASPSHLSPFPHKQTRQHSQRRHPKVFRVGEGEGGLGAWCSPVCHSRHSLAREGEERGRAGRLLRRWDLKPKWHTVPVSPLEMPPLAHVHSPAFPHVAAPGTRRSGASVSHGVRNATKLTVHAAGTPVYSGAAHGRLSVHMRGQAVVRTPKGGIRPKASDRSRVTSENMSQPAAPEAPTCALARRC